MTILEQTPTRLVIRSGPKVDRFLVAVFLLVVGSQMLANVQSTVFTCQRNDDGSGQCTLTEYRLFDTTAQNFQLEAIQAAKINTSSTASRGGRTANYELTLQTTTGNFNLFANSLLTQQYEAADRINMFLRYTGQRELEIEPSADTSILPFSLVFMAVAAWQVGTALLVSTLAFDRSTAQLTIRNHWLITRTAIYPLVKVAGTTLVVTPANRYQRETKTVRILMKSGDVLSTSMPYEDGLIPTIRAYLEPEFPAAPAKPTTVQSPAPAPQPAHRVKYRRAKRSNHDQSPNS